MGEEKVRKDRTCFRCGVTFSYTSREMKDHSFKCVKEKRDEENVISGRDADRAGDGGGQ